MGQLEFILKSQNAVSQRLVSHKVPMTGGVSCPFGISCALNLASDIPDPHQKFVGGCQNTWTVLRLSNLRTQEIECLKPLYPWG